MINALIKEHCTQMKQLRDLEIDCMQPEEVLELSGLSCLERFALGVFEDKSFLKTTDMKVEMPEQPLHVLDLALPLATIAPQGLRAVLTKFHHISEKTRSFNLKNLHLVLTGNEFKFNRSSQGELQILTPQPIEVLTNVGSEQERLLRLNLIEFEAFDLASHDELEITGDDETKYRLTFEVPQPSTEPDVKKTNLLNLYALEIFSINTE